IYNINKQCEDTNPNSQNLSYAYMQKSASNQPQVDDYSLGFGFGFNFKQFHVQPLEPCTNVAALTEWLNQASVRQAIHAPPLVFQWKLCSNEVKYPQVLTSMKGVIQSLITARLKILIYSGDLDMILKFNAARS